MRNLVAAAFIALGSVALAEAGTYNVTNTAQLEAAITASNGSPGPDTINLAAGTYNPSIVLEIVDDLTVNGSGAVIDGGGIVRLLYVSCQVPLQVTFNDLVVRNSNNALVVQCGGGNEAGSLIRINRSTLTGNNTAVDYRGGTVEITNSTLSGNDFGLSFETSAPPPLTLTNTTMANNGVNCPEPVSGSNILDDDGSCTGVFSGNPMIGPLADNGGKVPTHALQSGSPAIDAGVATGCAATDQRGVARPQGSACDIGAFEFLPIQGTFATSAGTFSNLVAVPLSVLPANGQPQGFTFPFGFHSWTVTSLAIGQTITVTITYPGPVAAGAQYWKVIDGTWTNVSALLGDNDGDAVLTLTITDGGLGDEDGQANGEISDPGGVGVAEGGGGPTCDGMEATIFVDHGVIVGGPRNGQAYAGFLEGTAGDDVMVGTDAGDLIAGRGGNDAICGGAGNDGLAGESGNDAVFGGPGRDALDGGTGADVLDGQEGDDILFGGLGNGADTLRGGPGRDLLNGWLGFDHLDGGPDVDLCLLGEIYSGCEFHLP